MKPDDGRQAAFITGGGSGLGRAVCLRLAARGDHVTVADVDIDGALATAAQITDAGGHAEAIRLDVTDDGAVSQALVEADRRRPLTTVVNNAGIALATPLLTSTIADFDRTFAVNVRGAYSVLRAAAQSMTARGSGSIVNICSTSSFTASSSAMVAYDMSKAALRMMTAAAARELGPTGVRVNGVAPGTMDTPLMRGLTDDDGLAGLAASRVPLGRLGGTDEVADAVAFLSCDQASYVTGHVLVVDGGWLA